MIVFPNAKINLGIDILRRRPDGFHDIATVMVPVPWRDILEVVPAAGNETTLTLTGRAVTCDKEQNLVMRAYRTLSDKVQGLPPADIYLNKIIPDGAGLGGGSSDAAFTLIALNQAFSLGLDIYELGTIAASVGSDCPFFIFNRPMLCTGRGTTMMPIQLDLNGLFVAIIKPADSVSTSEAYAKVTPQECAVSPNTIVKMPINRWQSRLKNDFEPSVFPLLPACAEIKERLLAMGALYASMSGSGSAVYGIFDTEDAANSAILRFPDCITFAGKL